MMCDYVAKNVVGYDSKGDMYKYPEPGTGLQDKIFIVEMKASGATNLQWIH